MPFHFKKTHGGGGCSRHPAGMPSFGEDSYGVFISWPIRLQPGPSETEGGRDRSLLNHHWPVVLGGCLCSAGQRCDHHTAGLPDDRSAAHRCLRWRPARYTAARKSSRFKVTPRVHQNTRPVLCSCFVQRTCLSC